MKIAVLVKQVPDIASLEFDGATRTLKREGVRLEVSAFDLRAMVRAAELREELGAEVTVLTMGPPQARDALVHAMALGGDRAIHLVDRAFAGADTLATARALAAALRKESFDLVLCGRASTDAETAQVGPEVAELLGIPQLTCVRKLNVDVERRRLSVERETEFGFEIAECDLPALVSAAEDIAAERFPRRAARKEALERPVVEWTAADLGGDPAGYGSEGSPTSVEEIESIAVDRRCEMLDGDVGAAATIILDRLGSARKAASEPPTARAEPTDPERPVWVVGEILDGAIRRVTLELLGKARQLSSNVTAVLLGHDLRSAIDSAASHGATRILAADAPELAAHSTSRMTAILAEAIRREGPSAVLFGSTYVGQDLAPRVAARLELGLTGDCIDLSIDDRGRLLQWKPAFGGTIVAPITSKTSPDMATVRPGMFTPLPPDPDATAPVEPLPVDGIPESDVTLMGFERAPGVERAAALDEADVAIGIGKGLGGPEHLGVVEELASTLGAAIAATRDVTDAGWLPRQHQVGLTGRAISPAFYLALGVKGVFEHTVGIRKAGTVVAVNNDPKAPIFQQADVGIVADWREVVSELHAQARARA